MAKDFDLSGLEDLIEAYRESDTKVVSKLGILGDAAMRTPDEEGEETDDSGPPTNAAIGLFHEFGTSKMPQRSWLRMPLQMRWFQNLIAEGVLDEQSLNDVIQNKSFYNWYEKLSIVALATVLEAFNTGGFGEWAPVKNMQRKKVQQILVETQQLRDSVTYDVREG